METIRISWSVIRRPRMGRTHVSSYLPWWAGYFLLNPFRKQRQNPHVILPPYVRENMTILEPGPGMGFFTPELAWLVGASGESSALTCSQR